LTRYAAFLSHYKRESGSDCRYIRDLLSRMLQCPLFLDSSDLSDLRYLFSQGVHKSDIFILVCTEQVLSRPWVLLELSEAALRGIPLMLLKVAGSDWDIADARQLLGDLAGELPRINPGAIRELISRVGEDGLLDLQERVLNLLECADPVAVTWSPHGTNNVILACALDVCDALAQLQGCSLDWRGRDAQKARQHEPVVRMLTSGPLPMQRPSATRYHERRAPWCWPVHGRGQGHTGFGALWRTPRFAPTDYAVFLSFYRAEGGSDARFLHRELERALGRRCFFDGRDATDLTSILVEGLARSRSLLLLQTKSVLLRPWVLCECYVALRLNLPIVTVRVRDRGYDFDEARDLLHDLSSRLEQAHPGAVAELQSLLRPLGADVHEVQRALSDILPNLISTELDPSGTDNQVRATIDDIVERLQQQLLRTRSDSGTRANPFLRVRLRHSELHALGQRDLDDSAGRNADDRTGVSASLRRSASARGYDALPRKEPGVQTVSSNYRSSSVPCKRRELTATYI